MKLSKILFFISLSLLAVLLLSSCGKNYSPEEKSYINKLIVERAEKDRMMRDNPNSPFNSRTKVEFHPLRYFEPDPAFVFKSKLHPYSKKDTVVIYGTKGEPRRTVRFGYVIFNYNNKNYKLNVYESSSSTGGKYYSIWFTDRTTNKETYGVGRYIDFEYNPDIEHIYTIDFNEAYNPYCAYSPDYSCAIPTKEDYLDLEITAGEKKFHE